MSFAPAPAGVSAMPLSALTAIVLDTETTGLDPATDRIVEIGAVRIAGGAPTGDRFSTLVDPGQPVPPGATAIHGLAEADLAGAPGFAQAFSTFLAWAGPAVVIGWVIGFDLAVLRAEHQRHGIAWRAPRALDLHHLVEALGPDLPDHGLETAAAWLGVPVTGRHRALPDAEITAAAFLALLPRLRARGIVTLAQAERAARGRAATRAGEEAAGWEQPAGGTPDGVYARIDGTLYRHRVREIMSAPALTVAPATLLRDALATMLDRRVSSLFVDPEGGPDGNEGHGIVTERDVMRAVAAGPEALDRSVSGLARRPLVAVEADEFVYRAVTRMSAGGFRHLGVTEGGRLVGALSARDLLGHRAADAIALGDSIDAAAGPAELGRVWAALTAVARALAIEEVDPRRIAAVVSRELTALTRRACELAEAELIADGRPPPCRYALMVLGSGGRGESLLAMDQDNAIVFAIGDPDGPEDLWFAALGRRVSDILDGAGVAYCRGGVMASNAAWRRDLAHWRLAVSGWIGRSSPEDILNCDIFFDAAPACGDARLAATLMDEARGLARGSRSFLALLAMRASQYRRVRGVFGRIRTRAGRVDLKAGGIMPIFSAARVAALSHGLADRATPDRLAAIRALGIAPARSIAALDEAHRILLGLILAQQLRDIERGLPLSNGVAPAELQPHDRRDLDWALDQVPLIADLLGTPGTA